jgi:hypothetical protein
LFKGLVDGLKVGEVCGSFEDFGIADNPLFVHHKCGSFGHPMHVEYEIIVEGSIGSGDGFVEIAEEGEVEVLVFFVFSEGKEGVYADAEDLGVGLVVEGDVIAGAAEFPGTGTGESLGEEKEEDIFTCKIAQGYLFLFGIEEGKVWCGLADLDSVGAHIKHLGGKSSGF